MRQIEISPSILSADFANLKNEVKSVEHAGVKSIHLDIMDGHFVPNISFGPVVAKSVRQITDLALWAHMMITDPESFVDPFVKAGVNGIVFHIELDIDHSQIIDYIKGNNIGCGIAVNPDTDIRKIEPLLELVDRILIMSVYPGFGGQKFIESSLKKISELRNIIAGLESNPLIEVDGGVNADNAKIIAEAGADILVAGSAVFGHTGGPEQGVRTIRNSLIY